MVDKLTNNDLSELVNAKVRKRFGAVAHAYVRDFSTSEGWVVFNLEPREPPYSVDYGKLHRLSATFTDTDVTLSEEQPEEVRAKTIYVTVGRAVETLADKLAPTVATGG